MLLLAVLAQVPYRIRSRLTGIDAIELSKAIPQLRLRGVAGDPLELLA